MFNAALALDASSSPERVKTATEQGRLDIEDKVRSSVLPWRGQFSPQFIEYLLERHAPSSGHVVDPFCGSGAVLYEAATKGLDASAVDINPAAVALAKLTSICQLDKKRRQILLEEVASFCSKLQRRSSDNVHEFSVGEAKRLFDEYSATFTNKDAIVALLMMAFGDSNSLKPKAIKNSQNSIQKTILTAPSFTGNISADVGDARNLPYDNNSADYIVTSPPYINVFNYHQNYRPIIEALGENPLLSARGEIGANRKFRGNRYITVVQYCMDIALFFREAARILNPDGLITIVLGRESKVRGVSFKNGALVAAIVSDGMGGEILEWNERKFLNRFGVDIYEDVLTIKPKSKPEEFAIEVGRAIGVQGLKVARETAPEDRQVEISEAMETGKSVDISPYVLGEQP